MKLYGGARGKHEQPSIVYRLCVGVWVRGKELVALVGGRRNAVRGIAEGLVVTGYLAAVYAVAMLAPIR